MKSLLEKYKQWRLKRFNKKRQRQIGRLQELIAAGTERVEYYTRVVRVGKSIPWYVMEEYRDAKENLVILKVRLENLQK